MAELVLKVGNSPSFDDRDILCAFNDARILSVHAEHICDHRKQDFNSDGLNVSGVHKNFLDLTHEYIFARVADTVIRTNLFTGQIDTFSKTPNEKGESIDVDLYLNRRLASPGHRIFGVKGSEFWYGGKSDKTQSKINEVWDMIEADTPNRRQNHKFWPLTDTEKAGHMALLTEDFDDLTAAELVSELTDENGNLIKKRKNKILEPSIPEITIDTLSKHRDRRIIVDNRFDSIPISIVGRVTSKAVR